MANNLMAVILKYFQITSIQTKQCQMFCSL